MTDPMDSSFRRNEGVSLQVGSPFDKLRVNGGLAVRVGGDWSYGFGRRIGSFRLGLSSLS